MEREYRSIPYVRVVLYWIAGILLADFLKVHIPLYIPVLLFVVFLLALRFHLRVLIRVGAALTVLSLAAIRTETVLLPPHQDILDANVMVRLSEPVLEKENSFQLKGELIPLDNTTVAARGSRVLFFAGKDEPLPQLEYGDQILVNAHLREPQGPTNPGQFDYAAYLARQGISYTSFIKAGDIQKLNKKKGTDLWSVVLQLREGAIELIEANIKNADQQQILKALLVGDRSELSQEVRERFSSTGTIHIMAVSGLHVGIIYGIFFLFLRRQESKRGRLIISLLALVSIWVFAAITGFSPPVQRACIMFSVLLMATLINKRSNIYNSLAFSALIILLIHPLELFEAGFQLSYAAVLGIVFFQPKLYQLLDLKWWLADKVWLLLTVSFAAQLLTAPLLLYYFHQFPAYFLLSNLFVVPLVPVILYAGFTLLIFGGLGMILPWTWKVLEWIVVALDYIVKVMADIPGGLIEVNGFDFLMTVLFLVLVLTIMLIIQYKSVVWLRWSAVLLLIITAYAGVTLHLRAGQKVLVFYDSGSPTIEYISGFRSELLVEQEDIETERYVLEPSEQYFHISDRRKSFTGSNTTLQLGDQSICLVSESRYRIPEEGDILYLNMYDELSSEIGRWDYERIILGQKCSRNLKEKIKNVFKDKTEIHDIRSQGSLVLNL